MACDLDRTLIAEDYVLRPRTRAALEAMRGNGAYMIVVTGRMFQAVRRYLTGPEPVVCYQGALVADPSSGEFLLHVPIPVDLAREAIAAVQDSGHGLNCYVDDELYVAEVTPEADRYASFQHLELRVVGPLLGWLDALGARLRARFDGRLFIAKSLPFFLELAHPDVSKGSGLQFVAERLGFTREQTIAFGDGENDLELIDWAGYSVAVENAHPVVKARADFTCPPVEEEGVAQVLEAFLAR